MGCEQCKLSDASESDGHENVIANVTADSANIICEAATEEVSAEPPLLSPLLQTLNEIANSNLPPEGMDNILLDMDDETLIAEPNNDNQHDRTLLDVSHDIDSNILDSTERLEANDEVAELANDSIAEATTTPTHVEEEEVGTSNCSSTEPNNNSEQPTPEPEPDNSRQSGAGDEASSSPVQSSPKPLKKRATVRINSIRGHKVTRKLSINPGDDVISNKRGFVQLGGHAGHFHIAGPGSIWKQQAKDGEVEAKVLKEMNESSLHAYVPDYLGGKEHDGKKYIGMEDLMCHFTDGCGMDIKMGTRTFKESEVKNQKLRTDLYDKMVNLDSREPTEQEHIDKAITKLRYMTFRERESSSQTLGFRIEAMKIWSSDTNKDFKTLKYADQVKNALKIYFNPLSKSGVEGLLRELEHLNQLLQESTFFKEHEFIGTSLLFIYDHDRVGVWMIDFGKTTPIRDLVDGGQITHDKPWELGNYEDGYFFGMTNLIKILKEIYEERGEDDEQTHQHTTLRVN